VLSWDCLALQSLLHHGSGFGNSRRHTQGAETPCYVRHRAPSHRGCIPRSGLRRLGSRTQDPPIRRVYRTRRLTVRRRPSPPSASRAPVRQPPAPSAPLRALRTERLARAPFRRHSTSPCPSRAIPRRGATRWTSKTLTSNRRPVPPLARQAGDHTPHGAWPLSPVAG